MDSRIKRSRSLSIKLKLTAAILVLALLAGILAYTLVLHILNNNRIDQGIFVNNIDLGGLDVVKARQKLEYESLRQLNRFSLTINCNENTWVLYPYDIDGRIDIESAVAKAIEISRRDNLFARFVSAEQTDNEKLNIAAPFVYNKAKLIEQLEKIKNAIDRKPVNAYYKFTPDDEDKFTVIYEETGVNFNIDEVISIIDSELLKQNTSIVIDYEPEILQPIVTAADLVGKNELLAAFSTDLGGSSENRVHNVRLAAAAFNGMVVKPGQVVSFNETVGERTYERGYKDAPDIMADASMEEVPGGGVCQTASTLYNAVLLAGLEVIESARHPYPIPYVDKGLDAAVNMPSPYIDLKFKNNKTYPVYIHTYYEDNQIHFEIYGEPLEDGKTIRLRAEVYETIKAPKPEYIEDTEGRYVKYKGYEYVKVKSRDGCKVKVYKDIYKGDTLVESLLLYDHYYEPVKGVIYTGIQTPLFVPLSSDGSDDGLPSDEEIGEVIEVFIVNVFH